MRSCQNKPLEATLHARARAFGRRGPVEHSMLLEDQKVTAKDAEARIDEVVRETESAAVLGLTGVSDLFEQPDDATPLTPEEIATILL